MKHRDYDPLADLTLSPAHRLAAQKQLTMLAKQTNIPELRDLAREVLSGRVNLRGALNDPRATTVLQEQSERFSTWYRELSVDERTGHENEAEQFAKDASSFAPGPEPTGIRRRPHTEEDDDEEPSTIFR